MRRMLVAAAFAAASASANSARAQTSPDVTGTTLPDVVVTATRVPTAIEQIPAGVTVIDRATIEQRGYTTLTEALETVPGMRVVQSGGPGGNASVFVRGTNSNQVLVLRDGMPVNDPSDPGGAFNFGVDALDDLERIEVVRGPMSSLYGSGAIGGVINLITRKGSGEPHGGVQIGLGLPAQALGSATAAGIIGKFDYSLDAEARNDRGFDNTPRRESVYTGARNGFSYAQGTINLGYTPIEGTRFSAYLRGRQAGASLDELGFPAYDANFYKSHDDLLNGRIGVTSHLFDGVLDTNLFLGRVQSNRHYNEPLEAADPNAATGQTRYHGQRTDLQWNNTVHVPDYGIATGNAITFGYEHILDSAQSSLDTVSSGFAFQSSVHSQATSDAGHVGFQTLLFQRLTATADVREEGASFGGDAFTWRAGGVFAVPEIWSRLKASYGTAFRAPSLMDLFGVDSSGFVGNPLLRPERSQGYELGWAIDVPAFGRAQWATFEATYFNNRIQDLITTVFNSTFTASTTQNVNRAKIQGVESSLTLRPVDWVQAILSYTFTDARNAADNSLLLRRPRDQFTANLRVTPLPGLTIAPELVYTGAFQDFIVDDDGFPQAVGRARAGLLFNMTVNYAVAPKLTLFVDARNIGNSRFEPASGFQTPGASVLAGVRARF